MNYYPNYYLNAPYGYQQQPFQQPTINGKIVDSADIVRVTEVPVGGYGVFPKADMSEVYIKTWGQDGKTQVIVYRPVPPEPAETPAPSINEQLLERLCILEGKIDNMVSLSSAKEVKNNEHNATTSTTTTKF